MVTRWYHFRLWHFQHSVRVLQSNLYEFRLFRGQSESRVFHFLILRPSTLSLLDYRLSFIQTVQFYPFELSCFCPLDRPLSFLETQFYPFTQSRLSIWAIHFHPLRPSTVILLDYLVSSHHGPSTLIQHRPLWT